MAAIICLFLLDYHQPIARHLDLVRLRAYLPQLRSKLIDVAGLYNWCRCLEVWIVVYVLAHSFGSTGMHHWRGRCLRRASSIFVGPCAYPVRLRLYFLRVRRKTVFAGILVSFLFVNLITTAIISIHCLSVAYQLLFLEPILEYPAKWSPGRLTKFLRLSSTHLRNETSCCRSSFAAYMRFGVCHHQMDGMYLLFSLILMAGHLGNNTSTLPILYYRCTLEFPCTVGWLLLYGLMKIRDQKLLTDIISVYSQWEEQIPARVYSSLALSSSWSRYSLIWIYCELGQFEKCCQEYICLYYCCIVLPD